MNVGRFVIGGALCSLLGAGPVLAQVQGGGGGSVGADGSNYSRDYPYGGYPEHINASGAYWRGGYWHGGYWRGTFWPALYYGAGFAWFLPGLPSGYATYQYNNVTYYYAYGLYYTWDPSYEGYVVTDPPPVNSSAAPPPASEAALWRSPLQEPTSASSGGQLFMYPKNGQTVEQQSSDRRECQEWAASQAVPGGATTSDYQRAMAACIEGRGYSVR